MTLVLLLCLSGCYTTVTNKGEIERNENILEEELMEQTIIYEQIKAATAELNEESYLYIDLLTLTSETEYALWFDTDQIRQGFHMPPIPNEFDIRDEADTRIGGGAVLPFPWDSDELRIVHMSWTAKEYFHVFGIDVGNNLEMAGEILRGRGYIEDDSNQQSDWHIENHGQMTVFLNNHIRIALFVKEGNSEIIHISVLVHDPFIQWQTEDGEEGVDWVG